MSTIQKYAEFSDLGVSATPGVCYLCRTERQPDSSGVCSTGHFIDAEGVQELCESCVTEMAALFGLAAPGKLDELRAKNRSLGMQLRASLTVQDAQVVQIEALLSQVEVLRDTLKK